MYEEIEVFVSSYINTRKNRIFGFRRGYTISPTESIIYFIMYIFEIYYGPWILRSYLQSFKIIMVRILKKHKKKEHNKKIG